MTHAGASGLKRVDPESIHSFDILGPDPESRNPRNDNQAPHPTPSLSVSFQPAA